MSLNSTTRTSVISRLQQYELAAADRVDVDAASYGGSSIGIRTPKEIRNASALMARNKTKNKKKLMARKNSEATGRSKQLRGSAAPPPSPKDQLADFIREIIAGPQA